MKLISHHNVALTSLLRAMQYGHDQSLAVLKLIVKISVKISHNTHDVESVA